ncbi:MAG TPA: cobalamin-binding protein [Longilinea sp.]|nr:cobalamin-binding protein [Longilinea sp.]
MKQKILFLSLILTLILAACGPVPVPGVTTPVPATQVPITASTALTFTDGLDRTITLPAVPQRIVSMAPSNTEILYAVGAGAQVVGRDDFTDYPVEALDLPTIGGNMGSYSLEAITALEPDLVLAAEINTPEQVAALEELGITVYYLSNPTDIEGMFVNLITVGQLTGHEDEANTLVDSLRTRVQAVQTAVGPLDYIPMVFYELDGSDPSKPWTVGAGTFVDQLISMAGGSNGASSMSSEYGQFSLEELLVIDPQIILLGDSVYGVTPEQVAARPGWDALTAVQTSQVFGFDDDLVSRPGPRMVDGLEALVEILHPGLLAGN